MVRQSVITLALLHAFVYEFGGNNTCIIQDRIALLKTLQELISLDIFNKSVQRELLKILTRKP